VRSGSYRPLFKRFFWIMVADLILLGWAGGRAATPVVIAVSQLATAYYFAHFLIILPLVSKFERPLPLPDSISSSALHGEASESAPAGITRRSPTTATPS
jgi:ubiquinol-cytochrome c reductase cytochrome b subunit